MSEVVTVRKAVSNVKARGTVIMKVKKSCDGGNTNLRNVLTEVSGGVIMKWRDFAMEGKSQ